MILVDFNQVCISNLMMQLGAHTNVPVESNLLRHMILNSLRSYRAQFGKEYGEMVLCCDDVKYWRRDVFPQYKANRKKAREASEIDWKNIFDLLSQIRDEIKENFPYRVIRVSGAEADDVIATLLRKYYIGKTIKNGQGHKSLILSADKDFVQLHTLGHVKQFDPVRKKWVKNSDPVQYLKEHIIKGDRGDGIPNIASGDNIFIMNGRQKPVRQTLIDRFDVDNIPEDLKRGWERNKLLIDLSNTPQHIQEAITEAYNEQEGKDRSKVMNYLISNQMKNLMENIQDF